VISGDLNSNLFNVNNNKLVDLMTSLILEIGKIDPSRESEPKDFHLNYSVVGLTLK
jgi:hypothetical protein